MSSVVAGRTWRDGKVADVDLTFDEIPHAVAHKDLIWVDLLRPPADELTTLLTALDIPTTSVEDALAPYERPKVVRREGHLFFTVYATWLTEPDLPAPADTDGDPTRTRLRWARISGIVLPTALVTVRLDDAFDMGQVEKRWAENADLLRFGSGALLHGLLDVVVDSHFTTIQELDDRVELLEDVLFAEQRTGRAFAHSVFALRKDLVQLRRLVLPMREVVEGVLRFSRTGSADLDAWYDDLFDHVLRASEWTESVRDMVTSLFETNLSLQDSRLNEIMKRLAAWAAIIAVPTAVTGWFGQNLPYPGFARATGLAASVALIVLLSGLLYVVFRRRDWL